MTISSSPRLRPLITNLVFVVICLGFGIWGAYDYWVRIPEQERLCDRYDDLLAQKAELIQRNQGTSPSNVSADSKRYDEIESELATFSSPPQRPGAFDRAVQLWAYTVGCGILGTPYFLWASLQLLRRKFRLDEDGTLHAPEGVVKRQDIADIDMSRWMRKSIATVVAKDGTRVELDDYKFKDLHLIVGAIAHRFYPDQWTEEARKVKTGTSRKRILFVCTANAARSIMAEAIANQKHGAKLEASSAGTKPAGQLSQGALDTLKHHGLTAEGLRSKAMSDAVDNGYDLVITLCDSAAAECPTVANATTVHWPLPDPSATENPRATMNQIFESLDQALTELSESEDLVESARAITTKIQSAWTASAR